MTKRYQMTISFRTQDPSPPEMEEFYESLSPTLREDKWYFQEYGIAGRHKSFRTIGFHNLTTLQASSLRDKAKKHLPKAKVVKRAD